ncbi:MAG: hypothetical protein IJ060_01925 [Oscillospiraceae bacterium]|nr:hypothetical protein [Oscillospiraceae bacterium]
MAKETKLFSVQIELNDRDYEDVFRTYLRYERGNEKKIGLFTSIALLAVCLVLIYVTKRIAFLFYGLGCFVIGLSYFLVPVNRKFLATNKLQFGEKQEIGFCPHRLTTTELFDDDEDSETEYEDAETEFSTLTLHAYENDRGFLFADGKIVNQFVYLPKRCLDDEDIEKIREYAENRCSGGYKEVETMIAEDDNETRAAKTDAVCDRYYGAKKLRLYDDNGNRVDLDEDEAEEPEETEAEEPEFDVDAEWERIISEDEDE